MAASVHECRRKGDPRQRVLMTATLFTPEGVQRVRVRDMSANGARILTQQPLSGAFDAIFKRGSVFAAARVVWSNGREAGLKFYRELATSEIEPETQKAA